MHISAIKKWSNSVAVGTTEEERYLKMQSCRKQCCGSVTYWYDPDPRIRITDFRIRGSVPLISGSADPEQAPYPDPALFVSGLLLFAYYFLKLHLHQSSKIKKSQRSHKTVL